MDAIYPGNALGGSALYLGLSLGDILYLTSSDDFVKADYPGLRADLVECQGGGSAGGGAVAPGAAGNLSAGQGGKAGGWCQKLYLATDLDDVEPYVIGAGGAGASGATGGAGGDTTFKDQNAGGAPGGQVTGIVSSSTTTLTLGGLGGTASGGDVNARGAAPGDVFIIVGGSRAGGMYSASSRYGVGGNATLAGNGLPASGYGSGGGGTRQAGGGAALTGGDGSPGLIIMWLLY